MTESDEITLPPQYQYALELAEEIRVAIERQDWPRVRELRTALPRLASDLENAWLTLRADYPDACQRLEHKRVTMIREILRVDESIRQMSNSSYQRLSPWLSPRPMKSIPLYDTFTPSARSVS